MNEDGHHLPVCRDGLVVEELDGEAVVYDPERGAVHRFNGVVMFVWSRCDGHHHIDEIVEEMAEGYAIDRSKAGQEVCRVIAGFQKLGLLDVHAPAQAEWGSPETVKTDRQPVGVDEAEGASLSRRQWIQGGVGILVFAPPVISTFFARGALAAYSPNPINPNWSPNCAGGDSNPGYSCQVNQDCCDLASPNDTQCSPQRNVCCIKNNEGPCFQDADCCSENCDLGTCKS